MRWLVSGPCSSTEPITCDGEPCAIHHSAAPAPDGSTVAVAFSRSPFDPIRATEPMTLVIVDPIDGTELRRVEVGPSNTQPAGIDFDGENVVLGRRQDWRTELAPILVEPDGTITEFAPGDRLADVR